MTTDVILNTLWFISFDLDEFLEWLNDSGIDDWDVRSDNEAQDPILMFNNAEDATAFRLRFGAYVL